VGAAYGEIKRQEGKEKKKKKGEEKQDRREGCDEKASGASCALGGGPTGGARARGIKPLGLDARMGVRGGTKKGLGGPWVNMGVGLLKNMG